MRTIMFVEASESGRPIDAHAITPHVDTLKRALIDYIEGPARHDAEGEAAAQAMLHWLETK